MIGQAGSATRDPRGSERKGPPAPTAIPDAKVEKQPRLGPVPSDYSLAGRPARQSDTETAHHGGKLVATAGVKVFTATKAKDREALGDLVSEWFAQNPKIRIVDKAVTQSSDAKYHCLSITLVYKLSST